MAVQTPTTSNGQGLAGIEQEPTEEILADSPMIGQSTFMENVKLCITSGLVLDGLQRGPKLLTGKGSLVNLQLLATPPLALTMMDRC